MLVYFFFAKPIFDDFFEYQKQIKTHEVVLSEKKVTEDDIKDLEKEIEEIKKRSLNLRDYCLRVREGFLDSGS